MAISSIFFPKKSPFPSKLTPWLIPLISLSLLLLLYSISNSQLKSNYEKTENPSCDFTNGKWVFNPNSRSPLYDSTCPFHRNAWNCLRNNRENMESINSWEWVPDDCNLPRIDAKRFLKFMRGKRIGFVGDSLNENFLAAFLCILKSVDGEARKWKRKGAWRGGYFPKYDVTVGYHRAVLLAKYKWQSVEESKFPDKDGLKGFYRVDVDVPADDWANITKFYDVLVFNTGHWWGLDKFPRDTPLVFYRDGKPINNSLGIFDGLQVVIKSMISHIDKEVPKETLKFWRTQSPRHFYGGEWNHNGSCLFHEPLNLQEVDSWFDPRNKGVNMEARKINMVIKQAVEGSNMRLLNLTYLSEFRADAHPAVWLGKKGAVEIWGQDCMHWCLPGLPDTWVDILATQIMNNL